MELTKIDDETLEIKETKENIQRIDKAQITAMRDSYQKEVDKYNSWLDALK